MNKTRDLKFYGLVCLITFALVFIGFHFLQAQVEKKDKPADKGKGKPAEVNWGVSIPVKDEGFSLYGQNKETYWNNDGDIQVDVVKSTHPGKEKIPHYIFQFVLSNDEIWAGFQNVVFDDLLSPDQDRLSCIFPSCDGYGAPDCMACFLTGQHPRSGYHHLRIAFSIHDYEIEDLDIGEIHHALHELDTISISVWYSSDCFQEYHNLGNWVRPADGLFIEKFADNVWKITVSQPLTFRETYCEEIPTGKGNRTKKETYTPLSATGLFNFEMYWIK